MKVDNLQFYFLNKVFATAFLLKISQVFEVIEIIDFYLTERTFSEVKLEYKVNNLDYTISQTPAISKNFMTFLE